VLVDVNWSLLNEFDSELPDELREINSNSPNQCSQQQQLLAVTNKNKKADDTIQRNRNLSQLLSANNDPRMGQYPGVHPGVPRQGMGVMPGSGVLMGGSGGGGVGAMGGRLCHQVPQQFSMVGNQRTGGYMPPGGPVSSHAFQQHMNPNAGGGVYPRSHMVGGAVPMPNSYGNMQVRHPDFMRNRSITPNNAYFSDTRTHVNGNMFGRHPQQQQARLQMDSMGGMGGVFPSSPFCNTGIDGMSSGGVPMGFNQGLSSGNQFINGTNVVTQSGINPAQGLSSRPGLVAQRGAHAAKTGFPAQSGSVVQSRPTSADATGKSISNVAQHNSPASFGVAGNDTMRNVVSTTTTSSSLTAVTKLNSHVSTPTPAKHQLMSPQPSLVSIHQYISFEIL